MLTSAKEVVAARWGVLCHLESHSERRGTDSCGPLASASHLPQWEEGAGSCREVKA